MIKRFQIILIFLFVAYGSFRLKMLSDDFEDSKMGSSGQSIRKAKQPSIIMYDCIEKYSTKYNIPKRFAYGVAYKETRYQGPFHWKYTPDKTSCAGAVGPMQIMLATAKAMWKGTTISETKLRTDIEFNVETSMKLLRHLKDVYGDWKLVFGCYNTGKPIVNQYALDVYNFNPMYANKMWIPNE